MQKLESIDSKCKIEFYYIDESHVFTDDYVPCVCLFTDENIYISSKKTARLNIFDMIIRRNQYKGFTTQKSIKA